MGKISQFYPFLYSGFCASRDANRQSQSFSASAIRSPANGFDFAYGNELWKIICRGRRIYGSSIQVQGELTIMLFVANFYINWWVICRSVTSSSSLSFSFSFSFSSSFSVFSLVAFILHFAVERGHINKLGVGSLVFFWRFRYVFPIAMQFYYSNCL